MDLEKVEQEHLELYRQARVALTEARDSVLRIEGVLRFIAASKAKPAPKPAPAPAVHEGAGGLDSDEVKILRHPVAFAAMAASEG